MIVTKPDVENVTTNVAGDVINFSIKASSHSFKILSSTLYANSIRAIIRELSCNALDSHAVAKNPNPIEVHLPDVLEPWFYVKDYGTGLSSDEVVNIYTTYFSSTKTNDNLQIGALGLGSKSPFAYTDNFTVTTVKDGWRGVYSALINEEGVPGLLLLSEGSTNEPNGVEVRMCVETADFYKFEKEAMYVFRFFEQKPRILNGVRVVQSNNMEVEVVIPDVYYIKDGSIDNSVAIMGNIPYPIDFKNLNYDSEFAKHFGTNYLIQLPIGAVDFQPSREGLKYTNKTVTVLRNILDQLSQGLRDKLIAEVDSIPNTWEKADFLCSLNKNSCYVPIMKSVVKNEFKDIVDLSSHYHWSEKFCIPIQVAVLNKELAEFNIGVTRFTYDKYREDEPFCNKDNITPLIIDKISKTVFIINKENIKTYLRYYASVALTTNNVYDHALILSPIDKTKEMDIAAFLKQCGEPPQNLVIPITSITPNLPEKATKPRQKRELKLYSWNQGKRRWDIDGTIDKALEASEADDVVMVYVPFAPNKIGETRNQILGIHYTYGADYPDLYRYYARMKAGHLKIFDITVYGVPNKAIDMVKDNPNWIELKDYVDDKISKITKRDISYVWQNYHSCGVFRYVKEVYDNIVKKDSLLAVTLEQMKYFDDIIITKFPCSYDIESFGKWYNKYGGQLNVDEIFTEICLTEQEVLKQYPLLTYNTGWYSNNSEHNQKFVDYINMVDATKDQKGEND